MLLWTRGACRISSTGRQGIHPVASPMAARTVPAGLRKRFSSVRITSSRRSANQRPSRTMPDNCRGWAAGRPSSVAIRKKRQSLGKTTLANAPIACPIAASTRLPPPSHWHKTGKPYLTRCDPTSIKYSIGNRIQVGSYNCPCSIFSWQEMQCLAQGTASSRFCCISSWQLAH